MKRICTGAYFDICQNCKYVCTRRSVVGSEFDTHYCRVNCTPRRVWEYECDNFKSLKDEE